jgi:hypothetical protein
MAYIIIIITCPFHEGVVEVMGPRNMVTNYVKFYSSLSFISFAPNCLVIKKVSTHSENIQCIIL